MNERLKNKGLEGTPLGDFAQKQEEKIKKNEPRNPAAIQTEETDKETVIRGLVKGEDPYEEIGYEKK